MKNLKLQFRAFIALIAIFVSATTQATTTDEVGAVKIQLTAGEYLTSDVCRVREKTLKDVIGNISVDQIFESKEFQEVQVQLFPAEMTERFFETFKVEYQWGTNALVPRVGKYYEKKVVDHLYSMFSNSNLRKNAIATLKTKNQLLLCDLYTGGLVIQIKAVGHTTEEQVSVPYLSASEIRQLSERLSTWKEYINKLYVAAEKNESESFDANNEPRLAVSTILGIELANVMGPYSISRIQNLENKHYSILMNSLFDKENKLPLLMNYDKCIAVSNELVTKKIFLKPFEQSIEMKVRK
jgi:hypothetical protein